MTMASDSDRKALLNIFTTEASDGLLTLANALDPRDGSTPTQEALHEHFIIAHSLTGAASLYGFPSCARLAEILALVLEQAGTLEPTEWPDTVRILRDIITTLRAQIANINQTNSEDLTMLEDLKARYPRLLQESEPTPPTAAPAPEEASLPDSYFRPDLEAEILEYFAPEAQEYLEAISSCLLKMEKDPTNKETIQRLFRATHTLKGSAYTVGFQAIGDLTHHMEDIMSAIHKGKVQATAELTDLFFRAVDEVRLLLGRDPAKLPQIRQEFSPLTQQLHQMAAGQAKKGPAAPTETRPPREQLGVESPAKANSRVPTAPEPDPRPLPVGANEMAQSTVRVSRDRLERLLNLVGELVVGRGRLEQRLTLLEQGAHQVQAYNNRMRETVRTFQEKHARTLPPATSTGGGSQSPQALPADFSAPDFDKDENSNGLARRMTEVSADVIEAMAQLSTVIRKAREDMGLLQQTTTDLRDEIARTRVVPIGSLFTRFQKAARETARMVGKDVEVVFSGSDTEVDAGVVQQLVDPLIHMIRNAVAHGIEPPAVRQAAGKPAKGTVSLHALSSSKTIVIEVEDDGAGLNADKIKAKAIALGLVRPERAATMPPADLIKLIYLPGFTTADEASEQAGRGVGMDVVRLAITDMNGLIDIETKPGVGTKFTLTLPQTMRSANEPMVRAEAQPCATPPSVTQETMRPRILLVDDSLSVRTFIGRMLEAAGYTVQTASDGEEGLRKATAAPFQVIIADLEMPKKNGYEFIQALRTRPETKSTPIIMMTTRAGDKHRQMAQSLGVSSYLVKPVAERALIQEISRLVRASSAAKPQ